MAATTEHIYHDYYSAMALDDDHKLQDKYIYKINNIDNKEKLPIQPFMEELRWNSVRNGDLSMVRKLHNIGIKFTSYHTHLAAQFKHYTLVDFLTSILYNNTEYDNTFDFKSYLQGC
jgi:hypothetical protein